MIVDQKAPPGLRARIETLHACAYSVPTESPESDGTLAWTKTVLVLAQASSEGVTGLGYSYADAAAAHFIDEHLREEVLGLDAMDIPRIWDRMVRSIRNQGRPGVAGAALSAVDAALWDLKARLLRLPLVDLLGAAREKVAAYGSGGFTSYTIPVLQRQLAGWAVQGLRWVKMKAGTRPDLDPGRVRAARAAIGADVGLFVDANGAYGRKQALELALNFRESGVSWLEEPVSSDDLEGLRLLRDRAPAGMDIAAGEYGYDLPYFRNMLEAGAVDVLQVDATRCGGVTQFLRAASLCDAWGIPLSAHCAPSLHRHLCCAATRSRHVEFFFDHARVEELLFEGAAKPEEGCLVPDRSRSGLGLTLKKSAAARYRVYGKH